MQKNMRNYMMMVAVGFAVATLLAVGLMDRVREPGPVQEVTHDTIN